MKRITIRNEFGKKLRSNNVLMALGESECVGEDGTVYNRQNTYTAKVTS